MIFQDLLAGSTALTNKTVQRVLQCSQLRYRIWSIKKHNLLLFIIVGKNETNNMVYLSILAGPLMSKYQTLEGS